MPRTTTTRYDVAEHLRTPEEMAAYLEASLEEAQGDAAFIAKALGDIARAKGMSRVAEDAGLSRESLYKALSGERNPDFTTILKVIGALGLKLHAEARPGLTTGNHGRIFERVDHESLLRAGTFRQQRRISLQPLFLPVGHGIRRIFTKRRKSPLAHAFSELPGESLVLAEHAVEVVLARESQFLGDGCIISRKNVIIGESNRALVRAPACQ